MLEDYTVTQNSDNRFRYLPDNKEDDIILGSTCTHVFLIPFLYSEQVIESSVIYRQGLSVIVEINSDRYDISEDLEHLRSRITVQLTPEETLLFNDNLLQAEVQIKIRNFAGEILYNNPNKLKIRRPLDIPGSENKGKPQPPENNQSNVIEIDTSTNESMTKDDPDESTTIENIDDLNEITDDEDLDDYIPLGLEDLFNI